MIGFGAAGAVAAAFVAGALAFGGDDGGGQEQVQVAPVAGQAETTTSTSEAPTTTTSTVVEVTTTTAAPVEVEPEPQPSPPPAPAAPVVETTVPEETPVEEPRGLQIEWTQEMRVKHGYCVSDVESLLAGADEATTSNLHARLSQVGVSDERIAAIPSIPAGTNISEWCLEALGY